MCIMMAHTLLFVLFWMIYNTQATWFPSAEIPAEEWNSIYSNYNILSTHKTCHDSYSGTPSTHIVSIYKKTPATIVVVGKGRGFMDVKFQESLYTFDHKVSFDETPCVVIPPYQPVDWIMLDVSGSVSVCIFEDTITGTSQPTATPCACTKTLEASTCSTIKIPHTIRKPEHEFFLTAEITPEPDDVTVTTILTVDRMLRLSQMSQFWGGPISAAVYLHELKEISQVYSWWLTNTTMRQHVDIHLVYDDKITAFELPDRAFPVNILRNVGIRFARTANVFYIEGDFIPSPDLYPSLDDIKKRLASGEKSVFIVAPFSSYKVDFDMTIFPKNKAELRKLINTPDNLIKSLSYYNSHAAFRYEAWYNSEKIEKMGYSGGFEPYYIGSKTYPLFSEVFIGCGADKVSHPTELNSAGYEFFILPQGFIVHLDSTGMGTAWCKSWGGNKRSTLKWEEFSKNMEHARSGKAFKNPWWDLAPVPTPGNGKRVTEQLALPSGNEQQQCPPCEKPECPKCPPPTVCPPCNKAGNIKCPEREPVSVHDCKQFIEGYEKEVALLQRSLQTAEGLLEAHKKQKDEFIKTIAYLEAETKKLVTYSNFITNLALGGSVVVAVVVGVVVCVWPRSKKVWALPTWKSNHHHL